MKLYLAGGLFTTAETHFNRELADQLRIFGHVVFLPQEFEQTHKPFDPNAIFQNDVMGVDQCQVIVANMDGPDQDSGTCWELGYAFAKGKRSILYRTDLRRGQEAINLMMERSADVLIAEPFMTIYALAKRVHHELRTHPEWETPQELEYSPIPRYRHCDK